MSYKLLILAPSAGGKSTLMHNLREHTNLDIAETDEEIMKANGGIWPDDELKNKVLVPQTTKEVTNRDSVIYFASYVPDDLIEEARTKGFKIILLEIDMKSLLERNKQRMSIENYKDTSPWLKMQLDSFDRLKNQGLIDIIIDGTQTADALAKQIAALAKK